MRIPIIFCIGLFSIQVLIGSTAQDVIQALLKTPQNSSEIQDIISKLNPGEINKDISVGSEWFTPLTAAVATGTLPAIQQLLESPQIDPNHLSPGKTQPPLYVALWFIKNKNTKTGIIIINKLLTNRALPLNGSFNAYTEMNNIGIAGILNTQLKELFDLAQAFSYASQEKVNIPELEKLIDNSGGKIKADSFMLLRFNTNNRGDHPEIMQANLLSAPLVALKFNAINALEASNVIGSVLKKFPGIANIKIPDLDQRPIGFQIVLENEMFFGRILNSMNVNLLEEYNKNGDTLLTYIIKNGDWTKPATPANISSLINKKDTLIIQQDKSGKGASPLILLVEQIINGKHPDLIIATIKTFVKDKRVDTVAALIEADRITDPALKGKVKAALGATVDPNSIINELHQFNANLTDIKARLH